MSYSCGLCGGASYKKLPYYYVLNGRRIQGVEMPLLRPDHGIPQALKRRDSVII